MFPYYIADLLQIPYFLYNLLKTGTTVYPDETSFIRNEDRADVISNTTITTDLIYIRWTLFVWP